MLPGANTTAPRVISARRRRLLKQLAAAGLLGPAGISGLIREALARGNKPIAPGLHQASGEVRVNGRPAVAGMALGSGDTIVTGVGAQAIYVIGQDAYLQREKSTVSFATEQTAGALGNVMRVITGSILSVFGKGNKTLQTATATIGIRGTGCYIESEARRVYFCLCYGSAEVTPTADPNRVEHIKTSHHDHPIYIHHDSAMPMMVDASVVNHSDTELEMLENLVGRWPPFYQSSYRY